MYGNVNPANVPYVGIKVGCQVIYATPNANVPYTIDISVTADGYSEVALRTGSTILTTKTFQLANGPPTGRFISFSAKAKAGRIQEKRKT